MHFQLGRNRQEDTLAIYSALAEFRTEWGGGLIVSSGLDAAGCAVALAAHVAGAVCLSIEPDGAVCRAAMRAGACDFLVNTVDEALRTMKNEVRRRRPLSVALELGPAAAFGELVERGVLPELFVGEAVAGWEEVPRMDLSSGVRLPDGMAMHSLGAESAAELKVLDGRLSEVAGADFRRRWVAAAPRLFAHQRPLERAILLTEKEFAAIAVSRVRRRPEGGTRGS